MMKKQWGIAKGTATQGVVLELELDKQCNYGGVVHHVESGWLIRWELEVVTGIVSGCE